MKRNLGLLILIGLALGLISLTGAANIWNIELNAGLKSSLSEPITPLQRLGETFQSLNKLASIQSQNTELQNEIQKLNLQLDNYKTLAITLDSIKASGSKSENLVNIINPISTLTSGYIYIDRGSAQQVVAGDLLIYGSFLIGVVDQVGINYSKVITVTSVNSKLPVEIGGHFGNATGLANLGIKVIELDSRTQITIGDEVKLIPTSSNPLLGKYKLGKVAKVLTTEASPEQTLEVNYPLNLFELKQAELVKHK